MPIDENDLPKYEKKDKLTIVKEFLQSNRGTAYSAEELFKILIESDFKKYKDLSEDDRFYGFFKLYEVQNLDKLLRNAEGILKDEIKYTFYYYISRG